MTRAVQAMLTSALVSLTACSDSNGDDYPIRDDRELMCNEYAACEFFDPEACERSYAIVGWDVEEGRRPESCLRLLDQWVSCQIWHCPACDGSGLEVNTCVSDYCNDKFQAYYRECEREGDT